MFVPCSIIKALTVFEVDGGVGLHNAERILQAGADVLVAGNAVLGADDPLSVISSLKAIGKHGFQNIPA